MIIVDISQNAEKSSAIKFHAQGLTNLQRCFQTNNAMKPLQNPINRQNATPILNHSHFTTKFIMIYFLLLCQQLCLWRTSQPCYVRQQAIPCS